VFQLAGGNGDVQGIADPPPGGAAESWPLADSKTTAALSMPSDVRNGLRDRALSDWAGTSTVMRRQSPELGNRQQSPAADRWMDSLTSLAPAEAESAYAQDWVSGDLDRTAKDLADVDATDAVFGELDAGSLRDGALERIADKLLAR
jgi:hypothetical protein